jgi:hypothetical protein
MGDRNNIKITYSTGDSVYLYGHWIGDQLRDIVGSAVDNGERVTDESYFARILFCKMVTSGGLEDIHNATGYGIAPYPVDQDTNNKMVHVDYRGVSELSQWLPAIDYDYEEEQ